jgi:hypothetical protein
VKRPVHTEAQAIAGLMISEILHVLILHDRDKGGAIEPALPEQKRAS